MSASPISIDVKSKTIQSLIDDTSLGKYFLPSFQRNYEWYEDEIKSLVDSVINNHPIGTIILWKPSKHSPESVDPFSRPLIDTMVPRKDGDIFYVIDGQQRLTSLLLMFNNWRITRGGEPIARDPISYNLSNDRFYKGTNRGVDLSELIKAFCLSDLDSLKDLTEKIPRDKLELIRAKMKKILEYPVALYVMETIDENETTFRNMAEAFIKVNRMGIRIGNLELMLSFLAGTMGGNLKLRISGLYDELYDAIGLDLQPVLRFAFSRFGLKQTQISRVDQFKANINKVSSYSDADQISTFEKSGSSMKLVVAFLGQKLGAKSSSLLPSQTAIVPLATYFYKQSITDVTQLSNHESDNILNWFILVSFRGHYSSRTDTKLDKDLQTIESSTSFPYVDLIANSGLNKIRLKDIEEGMKENVLRSSGRAFLLAEYILLVKNDADDWSGVRVKERRLDELDRHHIFPQEYLQDNLKTDDPEVSELLISNLGNVTFINKSTNEEIGDTAPSQYLEKYANSLEAHFIPTDKNLWTFEQYETFLQYRIKQIYSGLRRHFPAISESQ